MTNDEGWRWNGQTTSACLAFLLLALWLAKNPIHGVGHDGVLYLGQALLSLGTQGFERDLFFMHGSQGDFSIFTMLYRYPVDAFGPYHAHYLVSAIAVIFWLAAAFGFTRLAYDTPWFRILAIAGLTILAARYSYGGNFYVGERSVTARIFAEAFSICAITQLLERRMLRAIVLFAAAAAMHPIMALPAIALGMVVGASSVRSFLLLSIAAVLVVAAAIFLRIPPFDIAFKVIPPEIRTLVMDRTPHAFLQVWTLGSISWSILPACALAIAAREFPQPMRRLAVGICITTLTFLAVSILLGDVLFSRLVLSMQLWRVLWLIVVFGNLVAIPVFFVLPVGSVTRTLYAIMLGINVIEALVGISAIHSAVVAVIMIPVYVHEVCRGAPVSRGVRIVVLFLVLLAGLSLIGLAVWRFGQSSSISAWILRTLTVSGTALVLIAAPSIAKRAPQALSVIAVALVGIAALQFDQRSDFTRLLEQRDTRAFWNAGYFGRHDNVYWEGKYGLLWLWLGMPSYYSCAQSSGILFSPETAHEYRVRSEALRGLNTVDFSSSEINACYPKTDTDADGPESVGDLISACRKAPELDVLVLRSQVTAAPHRTWVLPVSYATVQDEDTGEISQLDTFYFYACADLRLGQR